MSPSRASENATRAERAQAALDHHDATGQLDTTEEPIGDRLVDLLTNIRHLAHLHTLDWRAMLKLAEQHFDEEAREQPARRMHPQLDLISAAGAAQ